MANANYNEARRQFVTTQELASLDNEIVGQLRNRRQAQGIGELDLIQGELNALQADLRRDLAYAELRNSYGQVFASAGVDPLPTNAPDTRLSTLANGLAEKERQLDSGKVE